MSMPNLKDGVCTFMCDDDAQDRERCCAADPTPSPTHTHTPTVAPTVALAFYGLVTVNQQKETTNSNSRNWPSIRMNPGTSLGIEICQCIALDALSVLVGAPPGAQLSVSELLEFQPAVSAEISPGR